MHFSKVGFDRSLYLSLPLTFPHVARMADNHAAAATLPGTPMLSRTALAAFVVLVSQTGCVVVGLASRDRGSWVYRTRPWVPYGVLTAVFAAILVAAVAVTMDRTKVLVIK